MRVPHGGAAVPPTRELRDTAWTRAGRGGLLAPNPRLCYPSLHPGSAALLTTRAPAGGRDRPPASIPHAPLGEDRGCPVQASRRCGAMPTRAGLGPDGCIPCPPWACAAQP